MNTLVAVGSLSSFIYSVVLTFFIPINLSEVHNLYFESAAIVIYFIFFGRFVDSNAKSRTLDAIKDLVQITPNDVLVKEGDELVKKTIDEIQKGDIIVCKTGMKIGVDGKITSGTCHIDQAFITGESKPAKKTIGNQVIAGSIVTNGYIEYQAEKIGKESTISEIVRLVVDATSSKMKVARIADIICG